MWNSLPSQPWPFCWSRSHWECSSPVRGCAGRVEVEGVPQLQAKSAGCSDSLDAKIGRIQQVTNGQPGGVDVRVCNEMRLAGDLGLSGCPVPADSQARPGELLELNRDTTIHHEIEDLSLTAHVNVRDVSELGLGFGSVPVADQARLRAVSGMEQTRLEPRRHARIDLHVRPLSGPALHRCCEATHVRCDDLAALRFRQGYRVLLDNAQDFPPAMKVSP